MWRSLICVLLLCILEFVAGYSTLQYDICGNNTHARGRSCTTQILGDNHTDINKCHVEDYPPDSTACRAMNFGPITSNSLIGGITLNPYLLTTDRFASMKQSSINRAVLNITFSNIKWKTMKFRFQPAKQRELENHCRDIILSNDVTINDQSILYYDCYWPIVDRILNGNSYILDFEASGDSGVNRGQYYFNMPSAKMLRKAVTTEIWQPFLYIEILTGTMRLHIMPPPPQLNITAYEIKIIKEADKGTENAGNTTIFLRNNTQEVTYDYSLLYNGTYYFVVTPYHEICNDYNRVGCWPVESPRIVISNEAESLNICIASITALIVATLFAYYIALRVIRRYWCKDYSLALGDKLPPPTKIVVVYSPANRLHAECVASFVSYLRSEYGFDVMYDGDIPFTSHGDPFLWASEVFTLASHVMYVVGPNEQSNITNNIYDKPVTAYQGVDSLFLSLIKADKISKPKKEILNVFFEHSNGKIPIETRHDEMFFLLKDWQKLIAFLSKNLLPKKQIVRTEKGRCFLEDLTRAKKLLSGSDIVMCDKVNFCDEKVLI